MEDEVIVQMFWERKEEALAQTNRKYGKLLRSVARNILRDERDAEEAVADTYMRLWNGIPPERPNKLMAYAAKLTRNSALDILRKTTAQKRDGRMDVLFSELDACLPASDNLMNRLEQQELVLLINTYLVTVDRISRAIFVRRYFAMEETEQLASEFGMTKNAISARLYRVRQGLREHLNKEGVAI